LFFITVLLSLVLASQPHFAEADKTLKNVQDEIANSKNQISGLKDDERALLAELVALESELHTAQEELENTNEKLAASECQLNKIRQSKESLQEDLGKTKTVLQTRLVDIYTDGRFVGLDFILSSKDISNLLCRLDYLNRIVKQDAQLVQKVESEKKELEQAELKIEQENHDLTEIRSSCEAKQLALDRKIREKQSVLADIRSRQLATEDSLQELQDSAVQIRAKMDELQPPSRAATRGSLRMLASGYCPCAKCCGQNNGKTATGLPAGKGVVAVDPKVIPLGTKLYISEYGEAIAGDIGGKIVGNRIDLGFDSHSQANAWGKRYVVVDILQ
jgi:3D (Asp-Asp-Asp) domain-containing protein/Skp family chaperone for outer membrane proteins